MDVDAHLLYLAGDIKDMLVVNARNQHRIYFNDLFQPQGFCYSLELLVAEKRGRLQTLISLALVADIVVNLLAYLRVDGIHGHSYVADSQAVQLLDLIRQEQAVSADAEDEMGIFFSHQAQGLKCLLIGQRLSRTGHGHHFDVLVLLQDLIHPLQCLFGLEHLGGHARPGFINAIIIPHTVLALDVAFGRHCQVHSAKGVAGLLAEARMLLYPSQLLRVIWNLLSAYIGNRISL